MVLKCQLNLPECVRARSVLACGGCSSARRGSGVLTRTTQGTSRSHAPPAVAAGREHRGRAKGDVLAGSAASRSLQSPQIVQANLVVVLLLVSSREVASIAATSGRTTTTTLVVAGVLLCLSGLCSLSLLCELAWSKLGVENRDIPRRGLRQESWGPCCRPSIANQPCGGRQCPSA